MESVNIGLIGCGGMAMDLARRCVRMERAKIVAAYDPAAKAVELASAEFGAKPAASLEALCENPDVNAIMIGSPPGAHKGDVLAAAAAGKPIYCEKPLGMNVAECDEMIAACQKANVPLFVGQVLRLFPMFWQSHVLVGENKIGTPRAVSVTRSGYGTSFHSGWRSKKALAGGLLLETNVHEFDFMHFILGEPETVYARLDNIYKGMDYEDQAFVIVSFKGGGAGCLHASLSSPIGDYRVEIQGTIGNIVHNGFGGPLRYQPRDGEAQEITREQVGSPDPYEWELTSWLDSLTKGSQPLFTGADGRLPVAMAQAAVLSSQENRPVALSEL